MRYKIAGGIEVRTENAAKPETQASKFLLELLEALPEVDSSFDYGCGKLRYQKVLANTTNTLAVVDSEIQLSRIQRLFGKETSIRHLYARSNRISIHNNAEFARLPRRFDRGFCINVLSIIPSYSVRRKVLGVIRKKLNPEGECLFVVQYRNSDFTRMSRMKNARPWLDGFLIESLRGHSFFGLISPDRLQALLGRAGFRVREIALNEGSAYVWAAPT